MTRVAETPGGAPGDPGRPVAPPVERPWWRARAVGAVCTVLALAWVAERVPALASVRVLSPRPRPAAEVDAPPEPPKAVAEGEVELGNDTRARADLAQPTDLPALPKASGPIAAGPDVDRAPGAGDASPVPIVDASRSLDRFFTALARTEHREPRAVTRVLFFGDSVVASDFGTGTLRRLLATRFGDAGHGFVLPANAWPQYFHNDVYRLADKGFRVSRIVGPRAADGLYGLGGVSFSGPPGLRARIGTARAGTIGRSVSRFSVAYLEQPGGGAIEARIDGELVRTIDTAGPAKHQAFAEIEVADGPHDLELLTQRGTVRLFGVVLERDQPGVVLDAIGVVGARLRTLDESDDAHFAESIAWRRPDLVVFQFGANESGDGFAYPMPEYHQSMAALLSQVARAAPGAACLVIGAMDRARKEGDRLVTVPIIPLIVEEQRKVAAERGCAFWSAFEAMGGAGSMARWVKRGLGAGDFTHPTSWGADQLGNWLYSALMARYATFSPGAR